MMAPPTAHVKSWLSYGARVRLLTQKNAGVCAARNYGIREAKGQYICLMDHDDYWFPDKLALQLEQMHRHPEVGLVYSSFIWWHPGEDGIFPDHNSFDQASFPRALTNDSPAGSTMSFCSIAGY